MSKMLRTLTLFVATLFCSYAPTPLLATSYCPPFPPTRILFVNNCNTLPPGPGQFGTGTYDNPYNNLFHALNVSQPCDVIYVFPGNMPYNADDEAAAAILPDGPYTLKDNQRLLGTTTEAFPSPCSDCDKPTLTRNSTGNPRYPTVVRILVNNANNEVSGFNIVTPTTSAINIGISAIPDPITTGVNPNITITHNTFLVSATHGIGLNLTSFPSNVDLLYVIENEFIADNLITHFGLNISFFSGLAFVSNNSFHGSIPSFVFTSSIFCSVFERGNLGGRVDLAILNNTISAITAPSTAITGITIVNEDPANMTVVALVAANAVNIGGASSSNNSGIDISSFSGGGPICLTLVNNIVSTPVNVPGYIFNNGNETGSFLLTNYNNIGTFETGIGSAPITYTYGCPDLRFPFFFEIPLLPPGF